MYARDTVRRNIAHLHKLFRTIFRFNFSLQKLLQTFCATKQVGRKVKGLADRVLGQVQKFRKPHQNTHLNTTARSSFCVEHGLNTSAFLNTTARSSFSEHKCCCGGCEVLFWTQTRTYEPAFDLLAPLDQSC